MYLVALLIHFSVSATASWWRLCLTTPLHMTLRMNLRNNTNRTYCVKDERDFSVYCTWASDPDCRGRHQAWELVILSMFFRILLLPTVLQQHITAPRGLARRNGRWTSLSDSTFSKILKAKNVIRLSCRLRKIELVLQTCVYFLPVTTRVNLIYWPNLHCIL